MGGWRGPSERSHSLRSQRLDASSGGTLFGVAVGLFAIGGLSGIGQVTLFRMDTVGATATTAGTMHLVLAGARPLLP